MANLLGLQHLMGNIWAVFAFTIKTSETRVVFTEDRCSITGDVLGQNYSNFLKYPDIVTLKVNDMSVKCLM